MFKLNKFSCLIEYYSIGNDKFKIVSKTVLKTLFVAPVEKNIWEIHLNNFKEEGVLRFPYKCTVCINNL